MSGVTCSSCGRKEDGEPELFCSFCGARRDVLSPGAASSKSEEEIVEEYVVDETGEARRIASMTVAKDTPPRSPALASRRSSSRGNIRRISIRLIPCEFEEGGVELVKALEELSCKPHGWVLTGYREDNATIYLQGKGWGEVVESHPLLKDNEQQYLMCKLDEEKDQIKGLNRNVMITWRGKDIPPLLKGKFQEHRDIVAKMYDDVHAWLVCNGERGNITKQLIRQRSAPLSGSHEL